MTGAPRAQEESYVLRRVVVSDDTILLASGLMRTAAAQMRWRGQIATMLQAHAQLLTDLVVVPGPSPVNDAMWGGYYGA